MKTACVRAFTLVALLGPGVASAQPSSAARGKALYDEGVAAYAAGDLAAACPKFKESHSIHKNAAPLFMVAKCDEKQGRTASALKHFSEVIQMGGLEAELLRQAAEAVSRLGPTVPRLTLQRGKAPPDAVAKIDGVVFDIGTHATPADPGDHELRVEAPGHHPWMTTVTAKEGETTTVELDVGAPLPKPKAETKIVVKQSDPSLWIAGGLTGGVGVASFVVFGITGGLIMNACGGSLACEDRTVTEEGGPGDSPSEVLLVANHVTLWVGVGGVGAGAALLIAAGVTETQRAGDAEPGTSKVSVTPGPAPLGLGLMVHY